MKANLHDRKEIMGQWHRVDEDHGKDHLWITASTADQFFDHFWPSTSAHSHMTKNGVTPDSGTPKIPNKTLTYSS